MRFSQFAVAICIAAALGCGGGGGGGGGKAGGGGGKAAKAQAVPLMLAAGSSRIAPAADDSWTEAVDQARLDLDDVIAVYDLTTPADEPFVFDVLSRAEGNTGPVRVSIAHAADDGTTPVGGTETIAQVGVVPQAPGARVRDRWLDARGDGFAGITLRGSIKREQIFAIETEQDGETETVLVRVKIGAESEINEAAEEEGEYQGVIADIVLYSSNSWLFGLPTIAVSGDRTSIITYEGDRADPFAQGRYEMRLQYDRVTGAVTGGASEEASADSGYWRDHEIAALFNILALVHSGSEKVTLRLSFDRGATFSQTEEFGASSAYTPRLAQIAMAADYTTAVLYWRSGKGGKTDLVLVEGKPSGFDGGGSPTGFTFGDEQVLYSNALDVTPMLFSAEYSEGGDLVVGYAFSWTGPNPDDFGWMSTTQNRCAVRLFGGAFADILVEEDVVIGKDPSVSLLGSGETMRIFYAYEGREGVRLRVSDDAGKSFGGVTEIGDWGANTPTVFARTGGAKTHVDVVYLAQGQQGTELHLTRWDDWGASPAEVSRLTEAKFVESSSSGGGGKVPGAMPGAFAPDEGYRITQVAWFGYDAVLEDGDIVIVYDEETFDAWTICLGPPFFDDQFLSDTGAAPGGAGAEFLPAEPPPLAAGLTEPMPAPEEGDMHKLRFLWID